MALSKRRKVLLSGLVGVGLLALWRVSANMCISAWFSYDVVMPQCPDGKLRQTLMVRADGLVRGGEGRVTVGVSGHHSVGNADTRGSVRVEKFKPELFLVDAAGKETPLPPKDKWVHQPEDRQLATVVLPQVPDGDYRLRVKVSSSLGSDTLDSTLALYAPARIHVITDRPLYQPGNTVRFRAVALRAKDLAPLDGRPGTWEVVDPSGETVLQESVAAADWGVTAGSFPLDKGAASGTWHVRWSSGGAADSLAFTVQPFTLPRFRMEVSPSKPFYRPGDRPVVKGKVVYSSGAPVAGAVLTIAWTAQGEWPPPTSWLEKDLPQKATANPEGKFTLELPQIPSNLRDAVTLAARIAAVDKAGDRVESDASVLMSEDGLAVTSVTELADGLVDGINNRIYVRATTPEGTTLPGATIRVKRAWDAHDKGVEAVADEDGVASFQIDPGPAVNVVIPPMPVRLPPKERAVSQGEVQELLSGEAPSLADQTEFERWLPVLEQCARFVPPDGGGDEAEIQLGLQVGASGDIAGTAAEPGLLANCALVTLRARRLPAGAARLYSIKYTFTDKELPKLLPEVEGVPEAGAPIVAAAQAAALNARSCLPETVDSGQLSRVLQYRVKAHAHEATATWVRDPTQQGAAPAGTSCVEAKVTHLVLDEEAPNDEVGLVRFKVQPSPRAEVERPQATTFLGYELKVSALNGVKELGSTVHRLRPGKVPPLRLRATPVLAEAGGTLDLEILRGPDFNGELPTDVVLQLAHSSIEAKVDPGTRAAKFKLPADAEGWMQVNVHGARALAYVKPRAALSVAVQPERPQYAPGQLARLNIQTDVGGKGGKAAVGLFGVDASLGQLVSLPGTNDMARVLPKAVMSSPAFGALDAQALTQGQIRGAHASAATILRVSSLPVEATTESAIALRRESHFDPAEDLTDHFYAVLGELHAQAKIWEEQAPAGEHASPRLIAELWERALAECEKRKEPNTDAYGRKLRLSKLPGDLLALTDPRQVIITKTRLAEDVESWPAWVAREKP